MFFFFFGKVTFEYTDIEPKNIHTCMTYIKSNIQSCIFDFCILWRISKIVGGFKNRRLVEICLMVTGMMAVKERIESILSP